jgi:hypothetical protein
MGVVFLCFSQNIEISFVEYMFVVVLFLCSSGFPVGKMYSFVWNEKYYSSKNN